MKKKLIFVFIFLLSLVLASCGNTHEAGSTWFSDDQNHWHECTVSGCEELFDKAEHAWGEWNEIKTATCKQAGEKKRSCTVCGKEQTEIIERLQHTDSSYVEKFDDIYHWMECSTCGQIKEGSKTEHNFSDYIPDNNATCLANGTKTAKCDGCSKTDTKEILDTMTEHVFVNYVSNNNATCTSNGTETAKCESCDEIHTREIPNSMLEHEMQSELVFGEETHYNKCKNCDYKENEAEHDWNEWNILSDATFDE
jgi:hypothetical protein